MINLTLLGNAIYLIFMLCLTAYSIPSKKINTIEFKEKI